MEKGVILQQGTPLQKIPIEIIEEINKKHKGEVITAELVRKVERELTQKNTYISIKVVDNILI